MKKLYSFGFMMAVCGGLFAQSLRMSQTHTGFPQAGNMGHPTTLAIGDTLLYIPFLGIQVNATDAPNFNYATEDLDGFTTNNTNQWPTTDWAYFYTLDPAYYHSWETPGPGNDTSFFAAATSWFDNDPALSDDWMEMGPITVPFGGATLRWFVHTNPSYRDGYEVKLSSTGMTAQDFNSPAIYSRADVHPNTTDNIDTLWAPVTVQVPAGTQYIAFHHNANGMDVLYLDEILLTQTTTGIKENKDHVVFSMFPNPAKGNVNINVLSPNTFERTVSIKDVLGKEVYSSVYGTSNISIDLSGLNKGVYFVSVSDKAGISTQKLVIQ